MKHYEPEFKALHPQVKHTAQWIFEHEGPSEKPRDKVIAKAIAKAKKHVLKTYGLI